MKNPTLPIVPMVYKDSDDNCSCVIGSVINCEIAEYTIYKKIKCMIIKMTFLKLI